MTKRERLTAIFRGQIPDRPAIRLWGVHPEQKLLHPAFGPVRDTACETLDLMHSAGSPLDLHWGAEPPPMENEQRETGSPDWVDHVRRIKTPAGMLQSVYRGSTRGHPGYQMEHLVKEPEDLEKLLSVPFVPHPFDPEPWRAKEKELGDGGITMFGLPHAMYGLQTLVGSENFAIWSIEHRDEMVRVMEEYARRILQHVRRALEAGIRGVYGWVGPELCIPPLMSPKDFDEFVTLFDEPIIAEIHNGDGRVWVHSHGGMDAVLERFMEMGVDVLNPLEPPPMGDVTLQEAFERIGDRMGIDGNIETHDFMTMRADRFRQLVRDTLECGRGRRLILCGSSGYMENPEPGELFIENLMFYVTDGVACADSMAEDA